jgi:hypothetical protein
VLELDHVFCMVADPGAAARRLEDDGWTLDAGHAHRGQGTRNRRLAWPEQFFELLWVTDREEARGNALRLDRRADWKTTGASPIGLAFRGVIEPEHGDDFWLYDALGPRIWIHRDDERRPERPLVFVLEAEGEQEMARRRPGVWMPDAVAHRRPGELRQVRVHGPSPPAAPRAAGPAIVFEEGPHRLELVVGDGGSELALDDALVIRRGPPTR